MIDKVKQIIERYKELNQLLIDPDILTDPTKYGQLAKEHHEIEPLSKKSHQYIQTIKQISEGEAILGGDDEELKEIVREEIEQLKQDSLNIEEDLKILLLPKDPLDSKNTIMEIRAGTGGEEAALFAADLYRMYNYFAEQNHWDCDLISANVTGNGGYKEVICSFKGDSIFGKLKYEGGVHRVQRVPTTETSGRIHTSAATVAVLPEADEVDIEINPQDLRIDTFRASGAGGQHVNKTESAVRLTHIPTDTVVTCQDEKSQHKNRTAAMKVLRSRLLAKERERQQTERAKVRKSMVSTGDRSAKIRTYNFPQGRVTDHRIDVTFYRLEEILNGDIIELIEQLKIADQMEQLNAID
ncbi:MAG: peptide chain release factor 1 [Candidatus Marinimicrobia bacterium]|nr:peptide chain release factor 1 [Candidatus Neomarinimicrobiota bacterium]|tara:strand:+ start:1925 stop:2989 length:1065 start_codon:yes stop_codon:yes gene_type:complete